MIIMIMIIMIMIMIIYVYIFCIIAIFDSLFCPFFVTPGIPGSLGGVASRLQSQLQPGGG